MNKVIVYSPRELDSEEKKKLMKQILDSSDADTNIDYKVDESLIDGLKIICNDKMLDLSLESQIKSLTEK